MKFDKSKYPYCHSGHQYALDIVSGKITSCIYVKGACERYLKDIDNQEAEFYFDKDAAERYLRLVQKFEHVIGKWKSKYIVYDPWQNFIWMNIMGFKQKDDDNRRFRIAHVEVARGNGKSCMASQCALFFLGLDEDPVGNQISTVATKRDQAKIVLNSSRAMALKNKSYLKHTKTEVLAHSLINKESNSEMRALSSESGGLDGLNDVLAICDELHAMKREVFDVITSGMSKRRDSLTLCITTAGFDIGSVGYSQSSYAKKVCTGEVMDDQMFSIIYTLDEGDDWAEEDNWIKSNPSYGNAVDPRTFRAKIKKALENPADVAGIRVKHLNEWLSEANAFFDVEAWDKCADTSLKLEDFKKEYCRLGLDLADHIDLASIGIVFRRNGIYYVFDRSFIPEETLKKSKNDLYVDCVAKGHLIETPGKAINFGKIQEHARELAKDFRVHECLYDPWNATETAQNLSDTIEMVKIPMNVSNFSEPMKKFDSAIREGKVRHNGSPLLRWCISNVVAKIDHNDNVFPRKSHQKLKIDPVVTILMAIAGWITDEDEGSVYEERGILTL